MIREARIEDVPFIVDMIRSAVDEGVFHSIELSVEEQRREFRNFAFENPPEGYLLLVYQIGNEIVGYIDSRVKRGVGHILGTYVKPHYRKKGVGKKLIDEILDSFRKKDVTRQGLKSLQTTITQSDFIIALTSSKKAFSAKTKEKET